MKNPSIINILLLTFLLMALTGCQEKEQSAPPITASTKPSSVQKNDTKPKVPPVKTNDNNQQTVPVSQLADLDSLSANKSSSGQTLTPIDQLPLEKATIISSQNPGLVDFDKGKFENLKGKSQEALYFVGKSCISCQALEKRLNEDKLYLPGGILIFKADAEKEKALMDEYQGRAGMMVVLDATGKLFASVDVGDLSAVQFALRKVME